MVKLRFFLLVFVSFVFAIKIVAQESPVKAYTDSTKYYVGDYIYLHIEAKHDKNFKVSFPSIKDSLKDVELIGTNKSNKELDENNVLESIVYTLAKYDSGSFVIPPLKIEIIDKSNNVSTFYTNKLVVDVTTLDVNQEKEIMDVKAPVKIGIDWIFVLIVSFIILVLLVVGFYGYKYIQKKRLAKQGIIQEIKIPPYQIALNKLKELEDKKLWQKGEIKEYHTEITFIIRNYFEEQFKFNALEMTSAEIVKYLMQSEFKSEVYQILDNFFANADMVKFAKFKPMPEINEKMLKESYLIIEKSNESVIYSNDEQEVTREVKNV